MEKSLSIVPIRELGRKRATLVPKPPRVAVVVTFDCRSVQQRNPRYNSLLETAHHPFPYLSEYECEKGPNDACLHFFHVCFTGPQHKQGHMQVA